MGSCMLREKQGMPLDRRWTAVSTIMCRTVSTAVWILLCLDLNYGWQMDKRANSELSVKDTAHEMQRFGGNETHPDFFKVLLVDGDSLIVGARNFVHNISMASFTENKRITWPSSPTDINSCMTMNREHCENYIRVAVKTEPDRLFVCGTNAYKPWCRTFVDEIYGYSLESNENGRAKCPYAPVQNNTAIFSDGKLYTATASDPSGNDPLLYKASMAREKPPIRTEQHDSLWLNEPNFVSSFEYEDQVYFFFREVAVEYINCGKSVFSRVGRVCKNDEGGTDFLLTNIWTSFFKSRLNCSIPGEFPFYFNELQSTTDVGKGNVYPTLSYDNKSDMVYAVFNTGINSISGSAVCAFRVSDIAKTFDGHFKAQEDINYNWLPVQGSIPQPRPSNTCVNNTKQLPPNTLNFVKRNKLMDEAVPAFGGQPLLVRTGMTSRMTKIAVDWRVLAADGNYYDVLYVGTVDGRVIKSINVIRNNRSESVIIEDILVFDGQQPVTDITLYRNGQLGQEKLIVTSLNEIKSIPLHRCHLHASCRACVALQDPYCSWSENSCVNSKQGIQSLSNGTSDLCGEYTFNIATPTPNPSEPCVCPSTNPPIVGPVYASTTTVVKTPRVPEEIDNEIDDTFIDSDNSSPEEIDNAVPGFYPDKPVEPWVQDPKARAATHRPGAIYSAETMAIATVICIMFSLLIGLVVGYRIGIYREARRLENIFHERTLDIQKTRYDRDPHNYANNDTYVPPPEKQLNVVFNPLKANKFPNGSAETKVQQPKVKKVYL